jgi:hypothetical protein
LKLYDNDKRKCTLDSSQLVFDNMSVIKSQNPREVKSEGARLIAETNDYLIYEISNYESSCYYGSGAEWYISGVNANNPDGSSDAWDLHIREGGGFMFLIKKNSDGADTYHKLYISYKDYSGKRYILGAFDSLNNQLDLSELKSIVKSFSSEWDYTYIQSVYRFGNVPIEIMSNRDILNMVVEGSYTIQSDGTVDVDGSVYIVGLGFKEIPVKFGKVTGNFDCSRNNLTSLVGSPQSVGGFFRCLFSNLTSLMGAPKSVGGGFYCDYNKITSLEGAPESVGGDFVCSRNQLTSLVGAPQFVGGNFYCHVNQLTSLKGAPKSHVQYFCCSVNELTSLEGAPKSVGGDFDCSDNRLTSLEGAPKSVGGDFDCRNNKVKFTKDDVRLVSGVKGGIIV